MTDQSLQQAGRLCEMLACTSEPFQTCWNRFAKQKQRRRHTLSKADDKLDLYASTESQSIRKGEAGAKRRFNCLLDPKQLQFCHDLKCRHGEPFRSCIQRQCPHSSSITLAACIKDIEKSQKWPLAHQLRALQTHSPFALLSDSVCPVDLYGCIKSTANPQCELLPRNDSNSSDRFLLPKFSKMPRLFTSFQECQNALLDKDPRMCGQKEESMNDEHEHQPDRNAHDLWQHHNSNAAFPEHQEMRSRPSLSPSTHPPRSPSSEQSMSSVSPLSSSSSISSSPHSDHTPDM
jgi:hypothetical protein